jgi:hypothetical protein
MPTSKNPSSKRDYKKEAQFENTPARIKQREERNQARAAETKKLGRAPQGDVAHIKPLAGGGANVASNEKIESAAKNRSWRKGQRGYTVPLDK